MIPDEIVKRIESVARIEDVVADFIPLRRTGVNMTGLCPFHDDKHDGNFIVRPSTISEQRGGNTYRCFVCDKKGGPVKFLMEAQRMTFPDAIRWLGRRYNMPVDNAPLDWTPPPRPIPKPLPRLSFKRETVRESMRGVNDTLFVKYLRSLPWGKHQREHINKVLHLYCVARCPHGLDWVAFWQIDENGIPLTAKYMRYRADGHRVKERDEQGNKVFAMDWEHAWRARQKQYNPDKWDTTGRTLFGCHLLKRFPSATVNIVESEKTALILAISYWDRKDQLFLACGGLKWLRVDIMQTLIDQGRTVWLWPDRDGREAWQQLAGKLGSDRVKVATAFYFTHWTPADGDKADAADINLRLLTEPAPTPNTQHPPPITQTPNTQHPEHDEPFYDSDDPQVREWRDKMRRSHRLKHDYNGGDTITATEVLQQHPEMEGLL